MHRAMVRSQFQWAKVIKSEADQIWKPPQEVPPHGRESVLLRSVTRRTRPYIEQVAHQINATYDASCFDACAVMIRRLVETLIIEAFEYHQKDQEIQDQGGNFLHLSGLIDAALACSAWNLSRNCKTGLKTLKKFGDRSAHSRYYLAHRGDIDRISDDVRVVIQELIFIANLRS